MNRRQFLSYAAATTMFAAIPRPLAASHVPEIAFTFDDPTTAGGPGLTWHELDERILAALAANELKSILFVCGKRVDSEDGRQLIAAWDHAGHLIANHSYSHLHFNGSADGPERVTLADFESDALKNEPLIRDYHHFSRSFRYPFFKEGDTVEKRDGMRAFLQQHGYRIGRATIDASDWAIDARLQKRVEANPHADLAGYRDFFLQHIWDRAQYYDALAQRLLRPVRHTVLLHHGALNAYFLGDLIAMFRNNGWKPVDAEYAYEDKVYDEQPKTLPAGESLIWALAKESGKFEKELRYPGEDDVYENPRMDALHL
ncbi:MAG TPA: polysaccharide deacetylase family protein [Candidatus Sulfotelmatobacter sp.]